MLLLLVEWSQLLPPVLLAELSQLLLVLLLVVLLPPLVLRSLAEGVALSQWLVLLLQPWAQQSYLALVATVESWSSVPGHWQWPWGPLEIQKTRQQVYL